MFDRRASSQTNAHSSLMSGVRAMLARYYSSVRVVDEGLRWNRSLNIGPVHIHVVPDGSSLRAACQWWQCKREVQTNGLERVVTR